MGGGSGRRCRKRGRGGEIKDLNRSVGQDRGSAPGRGDGHISAHIERRICGGFERDTAIRGVDDPNHLALYVVGIDGVVGVDGARDLERLTGKPCAIRAHDGDRPDCRGRPVVFPHTAAVC